MKPKKIIKKIVKIPMKIIDQYVEAQTGVDLSKIFLKAEHGLAMDAELVVSMPDGSSAEILWNEEAGSVSSSQVTAVVQSILIGRPYVTSIVLRTLRGKSQPLVTLCEPSTEDTSESVVTIQYSDIEEEDDATE
jgi:hypothetical protein